MYINFEPQVVHGDRAGSQNQNATGDDSYRTVTLNALQAIRNEIQAVLRAVSSVNQLQPRLQPNNPQRRSARLLRQDQIGVLRRQNERECFLQVPLPFMFIPGQTQLRVAVRGNDLTIHFTRRS